MGRGGGETIGDEMGGRDTARDWVERRGTISEIGRG